MNHQFLKQYVPHHSGKYKDIKIPFELAQAPAYFQKLITGVLKDFMFTITYLDDIIILSRTAEEHLSHNR